MSRLVESSIPETDEYPPYYPEPEPEEVYYPPEDDRNPDEGIDIYDIYQ